MRANHNVLALSDDFSHVVTWMFCILLLQISTSTSPSSLSVVIGFSYSYCLVAFIGDQVTAPILNSLIDFSETFALKITILYSERLIKNNIENIEND